MAPAVTQEGQIHGDEGVSAVIGGGISGITTAVVMQLSGLDTTIYACDLPVDRRSHTARPAEFATLHAAASILPHSVQATRVPDWTRASLPFFRCLAFRADAGVRMQTHYEIFEEQDVDAPPYADVVDEFVMLTPSEISRQSAPRRAEAERASGWAFSAYFCEAPTYLRYLYRLYKSLGGRVRTPAALGMGHRLVDYLKRRHPVIINCSGQGTTALLDPRHLGSARDAPCPPLFEPLLDPAPPRIVRGHYITAAICAPLVTGDGRFLSYNYTPSQEVYPSHGQRPADVYCYPRSDSWVLGGSRQVRTNGSGWLSDSGCEYESLIGAQGEVVQVPRPVFALNAELVEGLTDGAIALHRLRDEHPERFVAGVGYRFERANSESIRLGASRIQLGEREHVIVHNYGHGGAGFTLSWGCAVDVLKIVTRASEGRLPPMRPSRTGTSGAFGTIARMLSDLTAEEIYEGAAE